MAEKTRIPVRAYVDLLGRYLWPMWPWVVLLFVLMFFGIALQLINPQLMRSYVDTALAGGEVRTVVTTAAFFMLVALGIQAVSIVQTYISASVAWTATNALRERLAEHCLGLDMTFHKSRTPGEMIQRVDDDVGQLGMFFANFLVSILGNVLLLVGILVVLFHQDWRVGSTLAVYAACVMGVLVALRRIAMPYWVEAFQAGAEMYGFLEERLAGLEEVRANGAGGYVMRRFHGLMATQFDKGMRGQLMGLLVGMTALLAHLLAQAMGLAMGAWLVQTEGMSIGTVLLIVFYIGMLRGPLSAITGQIENLQRAGASVERITELFAIETRIVEGRGTPIPGGALAVDIDRVRFGYDHDVVLDDVSLRLEAGQVLGVLGRTGSGKTTLTRLLFRLYDPDEGEIRLGGVEVRDARLSELRRRVGMVTQDVQLFNATVRENLTLFDSTVPDERILEAIDRLGLRGWLDSLDEGLDTVLESGGGGLSTGEGQLLAFTRVFLRDPGLVVLDEASSRLDPATEERIEHAVDHLLEGRTGIIIAHRLRTVLRADTILILDAGRIVEYGERTRLAADPGSRFAGLLRTGLEEALA